MTMNITATVDTCEKLGYLMMDGLGVSFITFMVALLFIASIWTSYVFGRHEGKKMQE